MERLGAGPVRELAGMTVIPICRFTWSPGRWGLYGAMTPVAVAVLARDGAAVLDSDGGTGTLESWFGAVPELAELAAAHRV